MRKVPNNYGFYRMCYIEVSSAVQGPFLVNYIDEAESLLLVEPSTYNTSYHVLYIYGLNHQHIIHFIMYYMSMAQTINI